MERWGWMAIRAYAPAVGVSVFTVVAMIVVSGWESSPLLAGIVQAGRWVLLLALATTVWLFAVPTYRLWRWYRGDTPCCTTCGGPLGREREGYRSRGSAYRRCYSCGNNVNHRHYE